MASAAEKRGEWPVFSFQCSVFSGTARRALKTEN